jgi:HIRAN domain
MSFRDAYEAKARRGLTAGPVRLSFEPRDYGRGFVLLDGERPVEWRDSRLLDAGVDVVKVAGTSYRVDELQDPGFVPGSKVLLRPEPDNPHDPNAIGVWNAEGSAQAGFIPRERAEDLGRRLESESLEAFALWEWRDAEGRRCGLRIVIAPDEALAERPRPLFRGEAGADEPSLGSP